MERWFALPDGQYSRKGLFIAIERYGGSYDPEQFDIRNLKGDTEEDVLLFEISVDGKDFLDQSVRDGEQWKFRFFRKRTENERAVEQKIRKNAPEKIADMKRAIEREKRKRG